MRTSAKFLIGSLALGLFGSDAYATQGPRLVHTAWKAPVVALQVAGGSFQPGAHPDRIEAENWLRTARNAMSEGKLDVADFAIRKAEEFAARIPASEPALNYTPQQARVELLALSTPMPAGTAAPVAQLSVPQANANTPDAALQARVQQASRLLADAQSMLQQGNFVEGLAVVRQAVAMQVPETAFPAGQWTPRTLEQRVVEDMRSRGLMVPAIDPNVIAGAYIPGSDATRNVPASTANPFNGRLGQEPNQLPDPMGPPALDAQQDLLRQKLIQEILLERGVAERMVSQKDPRGALTHMQGVRARIEGAQIDPAAKAHMINIIDREIASLEDFIQRNLAEIEVDEQNAQRMDDVQALQAHRIEVEQRVAELVEQFNTLMDENRFMEAEVLARQAADIAPDLPVVQNMMWKAKYARNLNEQFAIRDMKADGVVAALGSVDRSSIPFDDSNPLQFDIDSWENISRRTGMGRERQRSAEEVRIANTLRTSKIDLRFDNIPLSEALDIISAQTQIGFYYDRAAMMEEGVTSDTPVSINLAQPITMESGLNLLLENLNLSWEVRDDVVRITSPRAKSRQAEPVTYYVGDLVMPIPNFIPTYNMGLGGALANAYANLGYGPGGMSPAGMVGGNPGMFASTTAASLANQGLAQNLPPGAMSPGQGGPTLFGGGPAGMGGGIQADFDPLMELIERTIAPDSWEDLGGTGRMQEFESNLSLVIYQSQEVHEQIQDLLDQLRRLQDLQITIEVRFITLQDDFFERIGVDFDFQVRDANPIDPATGNPVLNSETNGVFGLGAPAGRTPQFLPDGDIAFDQNSFGSAVPQFGGFDANTAANFGFAILSDIEVYMMLQAAKGDTRTNILQAPKVTLFNGQTALVNDTSQRPFVTGIIPVVGDFAAAQMPVVVVLNEGTQLSVNAVATDDRRFVRLTLVPFFSQIGDVEEFTFEGSETTTTGTPVVDPTNPDRTLPDGATTVRTGSTVQLPTFASTSINTTVSVPDGGTVLLGGIKRLQEGRNERGVPMLSNLPFVNRLFKNVGIGRTSQSLMMMVTPRIIIQEEEAQAQVGMP